MTPSTPKKKEREEKKANKILSHMNDSSSSTGKLEDKNDERQTYGGHKRKLGRVSATCLKKMWGPGRWSEKGLKLF